MSEAYQYKVSAIVSTYNSEKFIQGCLDDLFDQSLYKQGQLEIVVVDSGSQQGEWELIQGMSQRPEFEHMLVIRTEERETLYAAWNRAIKLSRGEYITNANTDDRHREDALEVLACALDDNKETTLVYGNCYYSTIANETFEELVQNREEFVFENSPQQPHARLFRTPTYFAPALLLYYPFGPQPMWRKSVHDMIGLFDETYKAAGDWDFAIRFGQRYRALHVDEYLGLHYVGDDTISSDNAVMRQENTQIRQNHHNLPTIQSLYRMEGILCDPFSEKRRILADMSLRAYEFVCPNGVIAHDKLLGFKCVSVAEDLLNLGGTTLYTPEPFKDLPSQRELSLWEE